MPALIHAVGGAGPAGGEPVPELSAGGAHHARLQLHPRVLATAAAHPPAPHVAGLGHGRRDVPPAAALVSVLLRSTSACIASRSHARAPLAAQQQHLEAPSSHSHCAVLPSSSEHGPPRQCWQRGSAVASALPGPVARSGWGTGRRCRRLLESAQPDADFKPSPFFAEQLRAFELWLEACSHRRRPPEQLPIVLQVRPVWLSAPPLPACAYVRMAHDRFWQSGGSSVSRWKEPGSQQGASCSGGIAVMLEHDGLDGAFVRRSCTCIEK